MDNFRRSIMLGLSNLGGGSDSINLPIYINLTKESNGDYYMAATPETIWLADYFIENASYNGSDYDLFLPENFLYINGVEIKRLSSWYASYPKYIDSWSPTTYRQGWHYPHIFLTDDMGYVKGDIWIEYDN